MKYTIRNDGFRSLGLEVTLDSEVVLRAVADKALEAVEDSRIPGCDNFADDKHLVHQRCHDLPGHHDRLYS